jgi:FixJ family two-component response regulator
MDSPHTILIVDDEPNILSALRRLLARENLRVLTATSGAKGLELLRQEGGAVALIISDQRMPQMIGAEFLAQACQVAPYARRMMLTGYSDLGSAVKAINQGGIHFYLPKPWEDDQLKAAVRQLLAQFELEETNRCLTAKLLDKTAQLEQLNAQLEETVAARTRDLQLKVKELEGKDRITQHLLTIHSLDETLGLVIAVVVEVLELERVVLYLQGETDLYPAAAFGADGQQRLVTGGQLALPAPTPVQQRAFAQVQQHRRPLQVTGTAADQQLSFAVVPVLRGEEFLGIIEVGHRDGGGPLAAAEVETVASFALQAAVAIHEAQAQQDYASWKGRLDEVLREVAVSTVEEEEQEGR